MRDRNVAWMALAVLVAADCFFWWRIFAFPRDAFISFLDVGQGDSSLLELPGGVRIMTDAGPDSRVLGELESVLPPGERYIDIGVITHPEADHFNGFNHILALYQIGAFIVNGRDREDSKQWDELKAKIAAKGIPVISVRAGDIIRYGDSRIEILSPDAETAGSAALNDGGIVEKILTPDFTALLAADIGSSVEEHLLGRYGLAADVLKVGHHGSKYSSGSRFLSAVRPRLAVISVAARNSYGHPAPETLARLAAAGIPVLRTDQGGTITVRRTGEGLQAFVGASL